VLHPHQVLLAAPFLQTPEVAANRGTHVVEMALFAHGNAFPTRRSSPSKCF
jgi:hypothetical protein